MNAIQTSLLVVFLCISFGVNSQKSNDSLWKKADAHLKEGITFTKSKSFEQANVALQMADSLFQLVNDPSKVIESKFAKHRLLVRSNPSPSEWSPPLYEALRFVDQVDSSNFSLVQLYAALTQITMLDDRLETSKFYGKKALELLRANASNNTKEQNAYEVSLLYRLGRASDFSHDYKAAETYYKKSLELATKFEILDYLSYTGLFKTYVLTEQHQQVEKMMEEFKEEKISEKFPLFSVFDFNSYYLDYLIDHQRYDEAIIQVNRIRDIVGVEKITSHFSAWFLKERIAKIYRLKGDFESSLSVLKSVESLVSSSTFRNGEKAGFFNDMAETYLGLNEPEEAKKNIQTALALNLNEKSTDFNFLSTIPDHQFNNAQKSVLLRSLQLKADVASSLLDTTLDLQYQEVQIQTLETAHQLLKVLGERSSEDAFIDDAVFTDLYEKLFSEYYLTWIHNPSEETFEKIMNIRLESEYVKVLKDLNLSELSKINRDLPKDLLSKEKSLAAQLDSLKNHSLQDHTNTTYYNELTRSFDVLKEQLASEYPSYYNLKYQGTQAFTNINALYQGYAILTYFWLNDTIYVLFKNGSDLRFDKIEITASLKKAIEELSLQLQNPDQLESLKTAASEVFHSLVQPYIKDAPKIALVLDGALYRIPFESILFLNNQAGLYDFKQTTFVRVQGVLPKRTTSKFEETLLIAPFSAHGTEKFKPLPNSGDEVDRINQFYKGNLLQNEQATKHAFLKKTNNAKIIHLATHAVSNAQDPLLSSVQFYHDTLKDPSQSQCTLSEIYNLDLYADLVTVSACETAIGRKEAGRGVESISQAFLYAGASSTLMSLWKVPDRETSEIMAGFYRHLSTGMKKDDALRNAKQDFLLANEAYPALQHPYYWSGFVLSGDTSSIETTTAFPILYFIGGLVVLVLLYFFFRKRLI